MQEWRITWGSGILKGFAVGASGTEPPGRSPERGCGNSLQYSCLEKLTDRGAWQAAVHGVTKSQTLPQRATSLSFFAIVQVKQFCTLYLHLF